MFLNNRGVVRKRFGRPQAGATPQANCPHGSTNSSSLTHGCSFHPQATLEQLPSPKRPSLGTLAAPPRRQTGSRCLLVWLTLVGAETAWDFHRSVWSAIVSRRDRQSPRRTAATNRNVCCGRVPVDSRVLQQARELGTPSGPKRGPSRTIPAWPLRRRPLLSDAGCIPLLAESSSKEFRTGTAPHG